MESKKSSNHTKSNKSWIICTGGICYNSSNDCDDEQYWSSNNSSVRDERWISFGECSSEFNVGRQSRSSAIREFLSNFGVGFDWFGNNWFTGGIQIKKIFGVV